MNAGYDVYNVETQTDTPGYVVPPFKVNTASIYLGYNRYKCHVHVLHNKVIFFNYFYAGFSKVY